MIKLLQYIVMISSFVSAVTYLPQDSLKSWLASGPPVDIVLIDIRRPAEITEVIGNTGCRPYNLEWPNQIKRKFTSLKKDQHIILYCRSGNRTKTATAYVETLGYTNIYNAGGILSWNGPKLSAKDTISSSKLPTPTMRARTGILQLNTKASRSSTSKSVSTLYIVNNRISTKNSASLFTLNGRKFTYNANHPKNTAAAFYIRKLIGFGSEPQ